MNSDYINKLSERKANSKILAAVFGDMVTMSQGDNVYFLSDRKVYGVGELICIGNDCKYDNYRGASALLPDSEAGMDQVLTTP